MRRIRKIAAFGSAGLLAFTLGCAVKKGIPFYPTSPKQVITGQKAELQNIRFKMPLPTTPSNIRNIERIRRQIRKIWKNARVNTDNPKERKFYMDFVYKLVPERADADGTLSLRALKRIVEDANTELKIWRVEENKKVVQELIEKVKKKFMEFNPPLNQEESDYYKKRFYKLLDEAGGVGVNLDVKKFEGIVDKILEEILKERRRKQREFERKNHIREAAV